ncbi:MAG: hypothetical protein NC416_17775 [Eubacterium sp.]|nr:hypothetical protein [Eubacterium sp.]
MNPNKIMRNKKLFLRSDTRESANLKALFASADACLVINPKRRANTLQTLRREIEHKEVRLIYSKRKIWQNQLRYADRSAIVFHLSCCALMLLLMAFMHIRNVDNAFMVVSSMILSGVLGSLSVIEIGRVCFAKLSELSESCFFNVRQLAAFELIRSGILNLIALTAGILFVGFQWKMRLIQIGLYILVPFIFTQCICLGVLLTETGRRNVWLVAAVGAFCSVFYIVLASMPRLYTESALFLWMIALVLGAVILGIQINTLFREISKGEILCTN